MLRFIPFCNPADIASNFDDFLAREKLADLAAIRQWNQAQLLARISLMAPAFARRFFS
jgi:hypothetical protein